MALHERDIETTHASADALGRIGSDDAFAALVAALRDAEKTGGERVHAILSGLGAARRLDATRLLAGKVDAKLDEPTARAVAKALGVAGNAWAWKTLAVRTDEAAIRETAARALVRIYVQNTGEARTAATTALLVVDDPHTPALVADARRSASQDVAAALDALSARLAANPTR